MSTLQFQGVEPVTSNMNNLPIDVGVYIDEVEYSRIMRRIFLADGGADTDVSAFNSSI
jgi:hypothetical protein